MKKAICITMLIIIIFLAIFFIKNDYKSFEKGNNMSNKSADEIKDYILNINSYEAEIIVRQESNKNTNTYKINETSDLKNQKYTQVVLEPQNVSGLVLNYESSNLTIRNKKLSLEKLYQNYSYIENRDWGLQGFIEDFKNNEESMSYFEGEYCVLETNTKNGNKKTYYKKLYINRETGAPIKIEIKDITQKTIIYILYNEIKINCL